MARLLLIVQPIKRFVQFENGLFTMAFCIRIHFNWAENEFQLRSALFARKWHLLSQSNVIELIRPWTWPVYRHATANLWLLDHKSICSLLRSSICSLNSNRIDCLTLKTAHSRTWSLETALVGSDAWKIIGAIEFAEQSNPIKCNDKRNRRFTKWQCKVMRRRPTAWNKSYLKSFFYYLHVNWLFRLIYPRRCVPLRWHRYQCSLPKSRMLAVNISLFWHASWFAKVHSNHYKRKVVNKTNWQHTFDGALWIYATFAFNHPGKWIRRSMLGSPYFRPALLRPHVRGCQLRM